VLEHMLRSWRCRMEVVESAAMAMASLHAAVARGDPFRVAIIDIAMPEVNGETLGRMIKATPKLKGTALIAWSSSAGRGEAAELAAAGFAEYLTKPAKQSQVFNAIVRSVIKDSEKVAAVAAAPIAVSALKQEHWKGRILLAEDNAVNQRVATAMLAKMGYYADVACNGFEALKALETAPYDMVLMDVHMPEMDGLEATRRIRDANSAVRNHVIPVVAMTASAMTGDREMCLDAGMNDYIVKPINRSELVRVLEGWAAPPAAKKTVPPEAEATQTAKVFDRSALLERVGGDNEICAEILKTFLADVPERIQEMEDALVRGDNETLGRGAHTIKGSAGNVGAPVLQEAAGRLEAAVAAGELGSSREKLDAIVAEFGRFKRVVGGPD
jgi:CheY-like chemotaxis protein/HPt (histidine-containing phosphotransfer) domain-containing protein